MLDLPARYRALQSRGVRLALRDDRAIPECVEHFKSALKTAYPDDWSHILDAFENASRGFPDKPIHYPRAANWQWTSGLVAPDPEGKNFVWFGENERDANNNQGPKCALDPLWKPRGLPMLKMPEPRR